MSLHGRWNGFQAAGEPANVPQRTESQRDHRSATYPRTSVPSSRRQLPRARTAAKANPIAKRSAPRSGLVQPIVSGMPRDARSSIPGCLNVGTPDTILFVTCLQGASFSAVFPHECASADSCRQKWLSALDPAVDR